MSKHIFIPIKEHSTRVPRKNFREFCGQPLYLHTLNKYDGLDVQVYVDTDSEEIIDTIKNKKEEGAFKNIWAIKRDLSLIGDDVSVNWLIEKFFKDKYVDYEDWVAQIHVTTPFLKAETVMSSLKWMERKGIIMFGNKSREYEGEYDSAASVTVHNTRFWRYDDYGYCPVNHNPLKLEKTQDLPTFYEENSCFYIFNSYNFLKHGSYRIGAKPFFHIINFPENIDIDTGEDWELCTNLAAVFN